MSLKEGIKFYAPGTSGCSKSRSKDLKSVKRKDLQSEFEGGEIGRKRLLDLKL